MPDSADLNFDPDSATIPMSGPRPTLSGRDVDLPLPDELAKLLPAGAYEVTHFLGAGGMGAVYKGLQIRLKRPVAIKIMRRDMGRDQDFEARFEREAQAMAKLNHPNIISVIDFGEAGPDYLFIVMELVDGTDLMDVIRSKQMTQEMVLTLLPQICDALQFAHDHGIVHRDIKPSNIMLTRDGRIKMADFGLAKHFDAESSFRTQTGTGMGTPDYAAPEQFSPNSPIDHRADIYALGVMIYQMITGQLPRGVWKPPSQRAKVAPQWDAIVSRAMQNEPADRYQQVSEVKTDVSSIPLASKEGSAGVPSGAAQPARPSSKGGEAAKPNEADTSDRAPVKSRTPLVIGLVVGAVVLAVGGFFAFKGPPSSAQSSTPSPPSSPKDVSSSDTLTWLSVVHSDGRAAPYHSESPDGWVTGTPDNPGGRTISLAVGPLGNFAIRLRYRWDRDAQQLQVKVRDPAPAGVEARVVLFSDHWAISKYDANSPSETRIQPLTTRKSTTKLGPGAEGMLEVAVIGDRLIARFDNANVLDATVTGMAARGAASIMAAGLSFRDVEMASLEGISDPLKALGWEVPLNWQKATWSANEVAQKNIVVEDGWARIGQATGALEKTWKLADDGVPVSLGDGAVRLRYRYEGRALTLKIRNHTTYGYVTLWPSRLDLGIWSTAYAEREKRVQTRALATPLKDGEEGVLELAADGRRLFCRLNETIVLLSKELSDLGLTGGCEIQSDGVTFRDVEYCHLSGIPDPLKALGWEEPAADPIADVGWSDLMEEWERYPDLVSSLEKESVKKVTDGWRAAVDSGVNATLNDPLGRDLAVRVTARFDPINPSSKTDPGFTVRARRTGPGKIPKQYTGCLFRSGKADLRVSDGNSTDWRVLKSFEMPAGFDPRQSHTIEISTQRDLISFHIDGTLIASVRDATLPPGGRFGMTGDEGVLFQKAEYRYLDSVSNPASATKDAPFINTLGMKFVPVPITGGPTDGQRVLFSIWETRVQDYEVFAKETKREWPKAGFTQTSEHPAVSVSWEDARVFCQWLTAREQGKGKLGANERYRLPSDHEWSCAVGIGDREDSARLPSEKSQKLADVFPWRGAWPPPKGAGNYAGEEHQPALATGVFSYVKVVIGGYNDGFVNTSPVGSFAASRFGLYDMSGNVWQWCEDRFYKDHKDPVLRGGSWHDGDHDKLLSSARVYAAPDGRGAGYGFRCVLDTTSSSPVTSGMGTPPVLSRSSAQVASFPATATKHAPFINTLGMKFVPVPITGGPTDKQRVLFSIWETRVRDYDVFAKATGRKVRNPSSFVQETEDHPVVNVTREDAMAFCDWLTTRDQGEGRLDQSLVYRLPSDHEWSCAVGIGEREDPSLPPKQKNLLIKDVYPWGTDWPPPPGAGNYLGQERPDKGVSGKASLEGYRDGFAYTAPVGRYRPNVLGLFDLGGNVWELTSDWTENVRGETRSVTRGAAFSYEDIGTLNSSQRSSINTEYLSHDALGFRVVLGPPLPDSTPADEKSSKHIDESGWNDFFEEWDRNPDRNNFERGSLKRFPEGWRPAGDGGANAYLVDPQGRDLAIRATAKFDPAPESKDNDQVTVRVRRRQGSALGKYNEYAGYLFRNGSAELQIVSDSGARIMKSADLTAGFEPHQFHTLELSTRGDQISFHVDGLEIASVKDGTHPAGGRFGINGSPSVVLFQSAAYRYLDGGKSPAQATKDEPFVNTLGMKFVPVPITGGPTDGKRVLFSVWETRVQDYEAFVKETKHEWEKPKFEQGPTHPTVMVSWEDAQAFCAWLTYKERKAGKLGADEVYRLPSDHEWSCAVGIGDKEDSAMLPSEKHTKLKTECLWGGEWPPPAETGNFSGEETIGREINKGQLSLKGYRDAFVATAPVGSFRPGSNGIFDLTGNVWEWCEDWFDQSHTHRVLRGNAWDGGERGRFLSSSRTFSKPMTNAVSYGFRVVLAPSLTQTTK